jgi:hypothetical protein
MPKAGNIWHPIRSLTYRVYTICLPVMGTFHAPLPGKQI